MSIDLLGNAAPYAKLLTTSATGTFTGTVPAGLVYTVQPISATGTFIPETFNVSGTAVTLTLKQLVLVTVLGISVTTLAVPSGAVQFFLVGNTPT